MIVSRRREGPLAAAVPALVFALSAILGWTAIAMALGAGPGGAAIVVGVLMSPCLLLGIQLLRMSPGDRAPLAVPVSDGGCGTRDRGACAATGSPDAAGPSTPASAADAGGIVAAA